MSQYSKKFGQEATYDSISTRFRDSLTCSSSSSSKNSKKSDFKEVDLGSPVSPLTTGVSVNNATTSSSSSSSSGSVSGKTSSSTTQLSKRPDIAANSHSGELSGLSETSPARPDPLRSGSNTRNLMPGHRRSSSAGAPLIYSGSSFGAASNSGATSVCTISGSNLLPSGNICPTGKILKTGLLSRVANKTDTLATGTGHYGHGSIIRGGVSCNKLGSEIASGNGGDPEELKRAGNKMYRRGNFVEALALYDKAILFSSENAAYRSNRAAALTAMGRLGEAVRECEEAVRLDPGYSRAHQRLASLYLRSRSHTSSILRKQFGL